MNYSTQTFEYKDLKANLDYLKKQPKNLLVPVALKDSIKQNSVFIEKEKNKERSAQRSDLELLFIVLMIGLLMVGLSSLFVLFHEEISDE